MAAFVKRRHRLARWPVAAPPSGEPAEAESNWRSPCVNPEQKRRSAETGRSRSTSTTACVRYALDGAVVWAALALSRALVDEQLRPGDARFDRLVAVQRELIGIREEWSDRPQDARLSGLDGSSLGSGRRSGAMGSGLAQLQGYPFEVRYSNGALERATAAADVAAAAFVYFSRLFSAVEPEIAVIVADERGLVAAGAPTACRSSTMTRRIRPGVVVMPAGGGDFWIAIAQALHDGVTTRLREAARETRTAPVGVDPAASASACSRCSGAGPAHSRRWWICGLVQRSGSARSS